MSVSCNSNTSSFTLMSFNSLYVHQLYIVRDWQHTDLCTCFFRLCTVCGSLCMLICTEITIILCTMQLSIHINDCLIPENYQ